MCQECIARDAREESAKRSAAFRLESWNRICPPRFRDTVIERLPYPDKSRQALEWDFGKGIGLNLWGYPDTGKTRTLYLALRQRHHAGDSVECYGPADFGQKLDHHAFARSSWSRRLQTVDYLALDDVDKFNLTKEQELFFFGLLDRRMSHNKPCLFTHNSTADDLEYKFRNGKAMVRRIRHFTRSIHFPERQQQQRLI